MTGAMYAAIGGLKSHMTKLNVIGNNVANVNTYGYKAQRMTFRESIYLTSRSGSNGGAILGGNTPSQIGYGCSVGTIDLNMAPSTYAPTGYNLDCMMTGEGFFMVGDKIDYEIIKNEDGSIDIDGHGIISQSDLTIPSLTRVGDFFVDADGYICNGDNKVLYGFARVQNPYYNPNASPEAIKEARDQGIDIESETIISTELVPLRVPLSAAKPTEDNGGKDATTGETYWEEGDPVYPYLRSAEELYNTYAYSENTTVDTLSDKGDDEISASYGTSRMEVARNTAEDAVSKELHVQLESMQIGKDGAITGVCNGKTVVIGYVAIASADCSNGVTHMGGPYYTAMGGAGNLRVSALVEMPTPYLGNQTGEDENGDEVYVDPLDRILNSTTNTIMNGGLEASSTDIATEFSEMITTQRGYQANTRIITVTDSMLEELVNMKR